MTLAAEPLMLVGEEFARICKMCNVTWQVRIQFSVIEQYDLVHCYMRDMLSQTKSISKIVELTNKSQLI